MDTESTKLNKETVSLLEIGALYTHAFGPKNNYNQVHFHTIANNNISQIGSEISTLVHICGFLDAFKKLKTIADLQ